MFLDIIIGSFEDLLDAVNVQSLYAINIFAATVLTLTGHTFLILIFKNRALRFQHGRRDEVLRGNQLDTVLLPIQLAFDDFSQFRICM